MSDVDALYRDVILDRYRRPRHVGALADARRGDGHNPLCGDHFTVYALVRDGRIDAASFEGQGCAIATASASLMVESIIGQTVGDVEALFQRVHRLVAAAPDSPVDDLGALSALAGVRRFPLRVKCAMLPWDALWAAVLNS